MAMIKSKRTYVKYENRLKLFGLEPLETRRQITDLTMVHKIITGKTSIDPNEFFDFTISKRKHDFMIKTKLTNTKSAKSFTNRVTNLWNSLDRDTVSTYKTEAFKRKLIGKLKTKK